ncbi:hypothetical protein Ocin01_03841, partial [Orchesella cincta]
LKVKVLFTKIINLPQRPNKECELEIHYNWYWLILQLLLQQTFVPYSNILFFPYTSLKEAIFPVCVLFCHFLGLSRFVLNFLLTFTFDEFQLSFWRKQPKRTGVAADAVESMQKTRRSL